MHFEPMGGFPPIIPEENDNKPEKTLESRGFSTTNIVSIANIMDSKKKEDLFAAFGTENDSDSWKESPNRLNNFEKISYKPEKFSYNSKKNKKKSYH